MNWQDLTANLDTQVLVAIGARLVGALVIVIFALLVYRSLGAALRRFSEARGLDRQVLQVLRLVLKWAVIVVTVAIIAGVLNIRVENLWIAISTVIAMVAIGFVAVWSVLSNVLCALILMLWRPFRVGQHIRLLPDDWKGVVEEINLFFTVLRTDDGETISIPNALFLQRALRVQQAAPKSPPAGV